MHAHSQRDLKSVALYAKYLFRYFVDGPPKQVVLLISLISHDSPTVSAVTSDSSVICTGIILILIGHHSFITYIVWLLFRFSRLFAGTRHRHISEA